MTEREAITCINHFDITIRGLVAKLLSSRFASNMDYKQTEPTQISTLLDIETLDVNLYRSKKVILPPNSRGAYIPPSGALSLTWGSVIGVFGGLVISHAMVAATKSVKPEFHLHVRHTSPVPSACLLTLSYSRCM